MNVQVTSRPTAQPAATSKLAIADGDIHPQRNSYKDLFPYMEARWVEMAKTFGSRPRQAYQAGPAYPKGQPNASRRDAWPPEGGRPGSSLAFLQKQLLDENNIQLGILNPTGDNGASFQNREFGAGVASAMNRWVEAEWLIEPRLKGSIVVPYEDADAAVAEIERWAGDPRFAQVLMVTRTANPPGQKQYWKIYEAAAAANLPVGVHAFGFGGYPVTGSGWPSFYIEDMVGHAQSAQSFLTSLVIEGVFERIPEFQAGADRVGLRLAAAAGLAARQALAPAEAGDAAPEARAVGIHPRKRLADHPADGGAAAARARAGRDRLDRLGPAAVRHRLPALGLRRSDAGAADAAPGAAAARLLLQQRDEAVPAGLSTSRTTTHRASAGGFGCMRKAASCTRCRRTRRRVIVRRAGETGIFTAHSCPSFRATGITAYLLNREARARSADQPDLHTNNRTALRPYPVCGHRGQPVPGR